MSYFSKKRADAVKLLKEENARQGSDLITLKSKLENERKLRQAAEEKLEKVEHELPATQEMRKVTDGGPLPAVDKEELSLVIVDANGAVRPVVVANNSDQARVNDRNRYLLLLLCLCLCISYLNLCPVCTSFPPLVISFCGLCEGGN